MAVPRFLKPVFLALAAVLAMTAEAHGQGAAVSQPSKVIPPSKNDRWMAELAASYPKYGELTLSQALFPGAHNAGAYELNAAFAPDIPELAGLQFALPLQVLVPAIQSWAENQRLDFTGQLNGGVRYFDLRLCAPLFNGDHVRFCHGLYGPTLEDGLNQIANWAAHPAHSKEILIVQLTAWHGFSSLAKELTKQVIKDRLGSRMFPRPSGGADNTLQAVWSSGKSIIVLGDADEDGFWSYGWMAGAWAGEFDLKGNDLTWFKDKVVANLACRCDSGAKNPTTQPSHVFFALQIQSTANVLSEIVDEAYIKAFPFGSQKGASDVTNPLIQPLVLDKAHPHLNVVVTDFATDYGFVEAIKNLTIAKLDLLEGKVARRAYLSRTESPNAGTAAVTTSWNGTHFDHTRSIWGSSLSQIGPGYPTLAHFGSALFAGDLKVAWIADDFLKTDRLWNDGDAFVDLNPPGLPPGVSLPASYAEAYGRLYVAWTAPSGALSFRSTAYGGFTDGIEHALPVTSPSAPVLATRNGLLYIAWVTAGGSLNYGLMKSDGTFVDLGLVAHNLLGRPAMTGFGDQLVFAWSNINDRKIRVLRVGPTGVVSDEHVFDDNTEAPPSLAVFKGSVVLAYTGQNKLRYTLISPDGVTFPAADRAVEESPVLTTLAPPTLHAWGDRVIITVERKKADGSEHVRHTWSNQAVTFTFTCEAPVAGEYGFLDDQGNVTLGNSIQVTASADGPQGVSVTCVDLSGYAVTYTEGLLIDKTPPTATYVTSTPRMPVSDWFTTDVVATFECSDNLGVVEQFVSSTLSTEGRNQLATGTCVDKAGNVGTGQSNVFFNIDKTAPTISVTHRTPAPEAGGWNTSPVTVLYDVFDAVSGVAGPASQAQVFMTNGKNFSVTVTDLAGNSTTRDVGVMIDLDPPTLKSFARVPADYPNANGWNKGPIAYTYMIRDTVSGTPLSDFTVTFELEGKNQHKDVTITDYAGHSTIIDFYDTVIPINIDLTAPTAEFVSRTPAPNASAWNKTPVTVVYQAKDALSGLSGDGRIEVTFDTEGAMQHRVVKVTDLAGNEASIDVVDPRGGIHIDWTAPSLTVPESFTTRVSGEGPYAVEYGPVTASEPTYADGVFASGLAGDASCDHPSGSPFQAGVTRVICTAVDNAGNIATKSFDVTVIANHAPAISGVSGAGVNEGSPATVTVAASDPDAAAVLKYAFDCDGNGSFEIGPQAAATTSCSYDDNGSRRVNVQVTDEHGATADGHVDVAVANVAPSASFSKTGSVDEGASFTLTLSGATDPSTADASAGFQYAFDCGTGYGAFSSSNTATCTAGPRSSITVRGKVRDKDGSEREYSATMTINGVPPIITVPASVTAQATGVAGAIATFSVSALDALDGIVPVECLPASGSTFPLGKTSVSCSATDRHHNTAGPVRFDVWVIDTIAPVVAYGGNAGAYRVDQTVDIRCAATDSGSGVASTTCADISGPAYSFELGLNTYSASATDRAGNTGQSTTTFTVAVPVTSLQTLVAQFCTNAGVAEGLNAKLAAAAKARNANARSGQLGAFENQVRVQAGKALTAAQADTLLRLVAALY